VELIHNLKKSETKLILCTGIYKSRGYLIDRISHNWGRSQFCWSIT